MNMVYTLEQKEKVVDLYKKGKTYQEIADALNISKRSIGYVLIITNTLRGGVGKHLNSRKKRKYNCNDDYFKTITEESAYWAGFIAADGNVYDDDLTICLQNRDSDHLLRYLKDLNSDYPLRFRKDNSCVVKIRSRKLIDDLETNYNITPRKSLTLLPPNIKSLSEQDHFIVGYLDGDGSIGVYGRDLQKRFLSICLLGTFEVIDWIKSRFETILNMKLKNVRKVGNIYRLKITGKKAICIFNHYSNLVKYKLPRKWDIVKYQQTINRKYAKQGYKLPSSSC